ncbi:MAG: hypothetical protein WCH34_12505 [Bacteroidota bacterium]
MTEIKLITRQYGSRKNETHMFEGKFSDNHFEIYPIFNFGQREQLRPIILGQLIRQDLKTKIFIKFRLPFSIKFLFVIAIFLSLGATVILMLLNFMTDWLTPVSELWWVIPPFIIVIFIIFEKYFDFKVSKSLRIIKNSIDSETQV